MYTDRRPMPFSLAVGMGFTLIGLLLLSCAGSFAVLLLAAALVGLGSSVFHPESSRVARMASGGRHGMAQSLFQVGGNAGLGPRAAAGRLRRGAARPGQRRVVLAASRWWRSSCCSMSGGGIARRGAAKRGAGRGRRRMWWQPVAGAHHRGRSRSCWR